MKTFQFLLILLILTVEMIGLDLEPVQHTYNVLGQTNVILSPETLNYFKQTKFIKGNHWDHSSRLGQVVGYNQKDIYNFLLNK
ncbi:MAG: hypothetical protein A2X64_03805 [Ignavibacteria bacterium GWF2_33_9]|nr:MAG: hypothetical protein A2X64_03805 [Ignavibacteria bacterium GWF2_33_9]